MCILQCVAAQASLGVGDIFTDDPRVRDISAKYLQHKASGWSRATIAGFFQAPFSRNFQIRGRFSGI
jgi:hypothetical protein